MHTDRATSTPSHPIRHPPEGRRPTAPKPPAPHLPRRPAPARKPSPRRWPAAGSQRLPFARPRRDNLPNLRTTRSPPPRPDTPAGHASAALPHGLPDLPHTGSPDPGFARFAPLCQGGRRRRCARRGKPPESPCCRQMTWIQHVTESPAHSFAVRAGAIAPRGGACQPRPRASEPPFQPAQCSDHRSSCVHSHPCTARPELRAPNRTAVSSMWPLTQLPRLVTPRRPDSVLPALKE
jgi:hypothetical protein